MLFLILRLRHSSTKTWLTQGFIIRAHYHSKETWPKIRAGSNRSTTSSSPQLIARKKKRHRRTSYLTSLGPKRTILHLREGRKKRRPEIPKEEICSKLQHPNGHNHEATQVLHQKTTAWRIFSSLNSRLAIESRQARANLVTWRTNCCLV